MKFVIFKSQKLLFYILLSVLSLIYVSSNKTKISKGEINKNLFFSEENNSNKNEKLIERKNKNKKNYSNSFLEIRNKIKETTNRQDITEREQGKIK